MKRLLVGFLASIGFLVILVVIGAGLGVWYVMRMAEAPPSVPERVVLTLDLRGGLDEAVPDSPIDQLRRSRRPTLAEVMVALDEAGRDPRVRVLLLRLDGSGAGLVKSQELRGAIGGLRESGVRVIAQAETFGELSAGTVGYYLASAADEIHLQPAGHVGLTGLMIETPFFADALEEIGIEPEFTTRESYKTVMDMATERGLTPANREMLESIADSLYDQIVAGIAQGRGLEPFEVRRLIDEGPYDAGRAHAAGLIDRLGYRDEARARALELAGEGAESMTLMTYGGARLTEREAEPVIALVTATGIIQQGQIAPAIGGYAMNADAIAQALADAAADADIRAILLRIDSGGGSAVASDTIARAVRRAREAGTPVIVAMGAAAASGGYWIAAEGSHVVASPATLTGSIGVAAGKPNLGPLAERLGVDFGRVQRGANADMWSLTQGYDADGRARLEAAVDAIYESFLDHVAQARGLTRGEVHAVAGGRVWTGEQAAGHGLIDDQGGFLRALALARGEAGLDADAPVRLALFPRPRDPISALLDLLELPGLVSAMLQPILSATAGRGAVQAPAIDLR